MIEGWLLVFLGVIAFVAGLAAYKQQRHDYSMAFFGFVIIFNSTAIMYFMGIL